MIKQSTLDLLDADLRTEQDRYHNIPYKDRFKLFSHTVKIDPHWSDQKFLSVSKLDWSDPYRFADNPNFESIITNNQIGIYIMYIRPYNLILDMPQYVMYVGISGEHGSNRPVAFPVFRQ